MIVRAKSGRCELEKYCTRSLCWMQRQALHIVAHMNLALGARAKHKKYMSTRIDISKVTPLRARPSIHACALGPRRAISVTSRKL
mmetsp:Transcript_14293/g.40445  ORF Transcript_14293/g.40445 Transcript_14293/m.40445 type:complete len:85 (-) Transcript_14293:217-471(-)